MCADFSARMPLATWSPARGVWETTRVALCGHSAVFSETWPTSGSMRAGVAYGPPALELPTDGSGSSSPPGLLVTPTAQLGINGGSQHPDKRKAGGHGPTLADQVEHLLPTPEASDGSGGRRSAEIGGTRPSGAKRAITLGTVASLLPTPRVAATRTSRGAAMRKDSLSGPSLDQALEVARGELPREFTSWTEMPRSWSGRTTDPPSDVGS